MQLADTWLDLKLMFVSVLQVVHPEMTGVNTSISWRC
jgi:hypothetical protein